MWGILKPFEILVSYVFCYIHDFLVLIGFNKGSGAAWIISIILLTITIRVCILPLFIRTIHSTRKMQALQPQIKAIQKKYKNKKDQASREALSKETMALYQKEKANPLGSCLPVLIQTPFFFALYRTLSSIKGISEGNDTIGRIDKNIALQIEGSSFFGIRLSDTFNTISSTSGHIVIGVLIATMCITMFISQRLVTQKNTPIVTKDDPMFKSQKMMMYIFPVMYIFSGVVFPVGVLLYWLTTNLWTLGQGMWQLHYMPTPGSEAAAKKEERDAAIEKKKLIELAESDPEIYEQLNKPDERKSQREQPKRKKKKQ